MKKLMIVASMFALSVFVTGCGGPKLPEDTIAAVYVDVELAYENGLDFIKAAIAELPDNSRDKAEEALEKNLDKFKDDISEVDAEWALFMLCGDKHRAPQFGGVIKCDCQAELEQMDKIKLREMLAMSGVEYKTINDSKVYKSGKTLYTIIDDEYVVFTQVEMGGGDRAEAFIRKLVALYRDGDGETADDFGGLDDLDDGAVARAMTAPVGTIVDLMGTRESIEDFGEKVDDEDLVEDLLDVGSLTLDLVLGDDEFGVRLEFDAGTSDFAKVVEGALNVCVFANRVGVDVGLGMSGLLKDFGIDKSVSDLFAADCAKTLAGIMRDAPEVDRCGSSVTAEYVIDTGDLMEAVIPQFKDQISGFVESVQ